MDIFETNKTKKTIETIGMMKTMLFQNATKERLDDEMNALCKEVQQAFKIDICKPVHLNELNAEEKKLVIPMMINYLEKYKPDNKFEKLKVQVLNRGDTQFMTGEFKGPVARVESSGID